MINPLVKIIELFVDEEQDAILQSISIVDKPAIEREFMYFSEDGRQMLYFQEVEDQRIVVSPAMIPDKRIARKDKDTGEIYWVYFSKDTVAKAAEYLMKYNKQSHSNINHQRIYSNDMYVMESWIKESDNDKSTDYGFSDLPEGTWFVKFRILNDDVWKQIKSGELKGLSVEGDFVVGVEKYEEAFGNIKKKYSQVRSKYSRAYKGLAEEEKSKLDEILYLVELVNADAYASPEEAIKRSKKLGLKGEIRSQYNDATGFIYYLPGPDQALYEAALIKEMEMEIEVGSLPSYVNQGETGAKALSAYEFQESYTDYPLSASNNAKKALEWRDKYPSEIQGGTQIGWTRANQLADRRPISEETIARMASFARHRQNAEVSPDKKDKPWTDAGYVAYLIWGGETGVSWATDKLERIRRQNMAEEDLNMDVFGYPTRFFYICPGAIATFEHIKQMNPPEDVIGMARSAAVQADRVFQIEKEVKEAGIATMDQFSEAVVLVDDYKDIFAEIDQILGMEHDISYMDGHIATIKSYLPEEFSFARYPWDQCISDRLADGKSQTAAENICGWIKANYSAEFAPEPASGNKGDRPLARIPKEERGRTGSSVNEPGDSTTTRGGTTVPDSVEKTLKDKIAIHNEQNPQDSQKATLGMLKAVWRRGSGAYSVGTPGKRGMARPQWAMARVNSFLNILAGNKSGYDKDYNQDNDLLPAGHPKSSKG